METPETEVLNPKWIATMIAHIEMLEPDGGFVCLPLRGLVYKIDRPNKLVELMAVYKPAQGGRIQVITERIFCRLGYFVGQSESAVQDTAESFFEVLIKIHEGGGNAYVDPKLIENIKKASGGSATIH